VNREVEDRVEVFRDRVVDVPVDVYYDQEVTREVEVRYPVDRIVEKYVNVPRNVYVDVPVDVYVTNSQQSGLQNQGSSHQGNHFSGTAQQIPSQRGGEAAGFNQVYRGTGGRSTVPLLPIQSQVHGQGGPRTLPESQQESFRNTSSGRRETGFVSQNFRNTADGSTVGRNFTTGENQHVKHDSNGLDRNTSNVYPSTGATTFLRSDALDGQNRLSNPIQRDTNVSNLIWGTMGPESRHPLSSDLQNYSSTQYLTGREANSQHQNLNIPAPGSNFIVSPFPETERYYIESGRAQLRAPQRLEQTGNNTVFYPESFHRIAVDPNDSRQIGQPQRSTFPGNQSQERVREYQSGDGAQPYRFQGNDGRNYVSVPQTTGQNEGRNTNVQFGSHPESSNYSLTEFQGRLGTQVPYTGHGYIPQEQIGSGNHLTGTLQSGSQYHLPIRTQIQGEDPHRTVYDNIPSQYGTNVQQPSYQIRAQGGNYANLANQQNPSANYRILSNLPSEYSSRDSNTIGQHFTNEQGQGTSQPGRFPREQGRHQATHSTGQTSVFQQQAPQSPNRQLVFSDTLQNQVQSTGPRGQYSTSGVGSSSVHRQGAPARPDQVLSIGEHRGQQESQGYTAQEPSGRQPNLSAGLSVIREESRTNSLFGSSVVVDQSNPRGYVNRGGLHQSIDYQGQISQNQNQAGSRHGQTSNGFALQQSQGNTGGSNQAIQQLPAGNTTFGQILPMSTGGNLRQPVAISQRVGTENQNEQRFASSFGSSGLNRNQSVPNLNVQYNGQVISTNYQAPQRIEIGEQGRQFDFSNQQHQSQIKSQGVIQMSRIASPEMGSPQGAVQYGVDRVVPRFIEEIIEKYIDVPVVKEVQVVYDKIVEKSVNRDQIVDKFVEIEKIVEVPIERFVDKIIEVEKIVEKPIYVDKKIKKEREVIVEKRVEVPVEKFVEVTVENVVEKVIDVNVINYKPVYVEKDVELRTTRKRRTSCVNENIKASFRDSVEKMNRASKENAELKAKVNHLKERSSQSQEPRESRNSTTMNNFDKYQALKTRYDQLNLKLSKLPQDTSRVRGRLSVDGALSQAIMSERSFRQPEQEQLRSQGKALEGESVYRPLTALPVPTTTTLNYVNDGRQQNNTVSSMVLTSQRL
jgi:hypothetical protein